MKKLHLFILSFCLTCCAIPVLSQNKELEPNDGFSTANALSFDTELKGTSISRNEDFFKITVSKPMVLNITVSGVTLGQSIKADLYDPALKFIDSKFTLSSGGTILLSQLVCTVGVYYIKLNSVTGSSDYTLKVKSDASDVYECNNTFNDATGIPFDKEIKASINSAGDEDFYKVNMLKPAVLNISVENVPSDQKMYVFLYDSKQEYLGKETASDNGKNVYFSQLGCGGTYYIKVYSINNVANNAQYTLKVNADASDIYECNNSFNDAKQIGSNSEIKASINTSNDVDFYKITITKPTDVNISVEGVDASQSMSIEMYDDKQIKLGRAFGNKGMNIFYNQLVCSSGTYYIKLFSLGGPSASQYTMKVKADPFQPTITTSNSIICIGSSATLTASACTGGTLTWTGGLTGSSITVSPTATKSYKVLCTRGGCKSDSSIATSVTVLPKPGAPTIFSNINCAIPVTKQWDKTLKGNGSENVRVMLALADGGYILGGENQSTLTNSLDYWLVKIDANGNKVWEKTFGGTKDENLASMVATVDGGYVLFGYSNSDISGDKSEASRGLNDYWVIKVNANGTKVWDKTFGGIAHDIPKSIVAASDGGFLLGGQSLSGLNGDKSEASKGTYDYWVVKINANGAKLWDKSFGGDGEENFSSMVLTNDGGFVLGGYSSSGISGNKSETARGASDYWVVKINSTGTKVWDKTFGGSSVDILSSIVYTADGGFLLGGGSLSTLSGDKSESSRGDFDYWVVKLNPNGIKLWDKTFGGNNVDYFRSMVSTNDGGVLLAGDSFSGVGNEKSEASKGNMDYWIVKVNASGVKVWDKSFGGNNNDFLTNIVLTYDGGFLVSGSSLSGLSGDKTDVGTQSQYCWLVKASVCNPNNILSSQKPTLTATGCTDIVTWSNGVAGNSITVSPSTTTTYTATCTVNGCLSGSSNAITVTVPVKPKTPTITASNTSICGGTNATLTASACDGGTLSWTGGLTGNSITVSPIATKAYKVVCSQQGISSDSSLATTITVIPKPTQPKITASNTSICVGSSTVLTASACTGGTLRWTGGLTGSTITVSPAKTIAYKVLCTIGGCKSDSSVATTITVMTKPVQPQITASNTSICVGSSTVLTASACTGGTLSWTGGLTGSSITVSPTVSKSYKVLCTQSGCKSDSSLATTITVMAKPNAPSITSQSTTVSSVVKEWEKTFGGDWYDYLSCIVPTQDGGYLLGGNSKSTTISGDKSEDIVGGWIVKINADGKKIWDKGYKDIFIGPNGTRIGLSSIVPTSDGGFLLGGTSTANIGGIDYWIIKINANGSRVWDKTFGGIAEDYLVKIISTSDGGFLIGGSSMSGTNGYLDYLVVKVDANGNKQWAKFFGGAGHETLSSIIKTSDGGYLLAGDSHSNIGGDKSENSKGLYSSDYWIVKIDASGNKMWDKTLGGDNNDGSPDVVLTPDGGFLVGGSSSSRISGDKSENYKGDIGYDDFWIIKLDSKGTKIWDRTFGGSMNDKLIKIMVTPDGGFLLGGSSYSGISVDKSEDTPGHWLIKINANGQKIWDKTYGGIGTEAGIYDLLPTSDGGYIFGGSSRSSNAQMDYWIVKIKENKTTTTTTLTATGCSGIVTWSNGVVGNSITVSPSTTTTYTATCTVNGCLSGSSNAITVTVPIKPQTPTITSSNTSICGGTNATLTASACDGGTLSWTGGLTGNSITVSPIATKAYKVVCSQQGISSDSSLATTITVIPKPTQPKITVSNTSICLGSSAVLTASACTGGTLSWTGGLTGSSITVSPTVIKSYKVLCTIGGCKSDSSLATTIAVMAKPTQPKITASNTSICVGGSTVLTASACTGGTLSWTGGLTGSSITVSPTVTKSYKVLCTQGGCKSDSSLATTITVITKPTQPKITASNTSICVGSSATLTASACTGGTLSWTGGLTGSSITVSPTVIKSYKVLCTIGGCKSDSSLATTIAVMAKPTQPKISASNTSICAGSSSVLTASACTGGTLTWTGGLTGSSITVSPTVTKSYKVLCTQSGCKSDSSVATTITVITKPTQPKITASNTSICIGSSSVLTASACTGGTLTWTGGLTGSSITVSPTVTKSYKVLCTQSGCKSDSSVATTIVVMAKPTQPKITASNTSICVGTSTVLTASACTGGTLSWTGGLTGSSITVSPTVIKSYKVLCTIGGCKSDSSLATTIAVMAKPSQPKITASNTIICAGSSSVLAASACTGGTLSWTGGLTGSSITVSPTVTKSYKVLCTQSGCKSDSSVATTITVITKPSQPKITASNTSICVGSSAVLTASACTGGTLSWTGGLTGSSITVSPTVIKSYKVLCTIGGCKSDSSLATTIAVMAKPTQPKITASNTSICVGTSTVLTASACTGGTLSWTGGLTGSSITVSPTVTKSYKVLCTQSGCKSDSSVATTITVITKPSQPKITASNTSICLGSSAVLTASACTGGTLSWTGGLTGSSITVSPTVIKSYKVLCTIGGCKSDSSLATTIAVMAKPTQPKISASNTSICAGSSSVLTASACTGGTLSWTGGLTGSSITVSPTASKSYKVLCTQSGCNSDSSVATTIVVMAKPSQPKITASNTSICVGSSAVLTASACTGGTLSWTGGLTGSSITVSPTVTKSYKVLCTQGGCKSDSSVATTITVITKPTQPKITASNTSICVGSSATLTASACTGGTLSWTGGLTGSSITVSPTVSKSYKVLCTQGGCKSDSSLATTIAVMAKPTQPKITASNTSICAGSSSVLTASACTGGTLSWTGGLTGSSITVSPTVTKSYKVLCTQSGCKSDSSVATTITVIAKPSQPKITASNTSICVGSSAVLTASACTGGTLSWTGGLTGSSITVSPTKTKAYKVLCTQGSCKSDSSEATIISVIPKPSAPIIAKLLNNVLVKWDRTIGGNDDENLKVIVPTKDGGFILGGDSNSGVSGEKTQVNKGGQDYWVVKIDVNGNKLWDKSFGGSSEDNLQSIVSTNDGGFILGGYSQSGISGDKTQASKGSSDYWIVKIDANGNKIWDKSFGGNEQDNLQSIVASNDGGFILGGDSWWSGISGDKTQYSRGTADYWIVKIDANGNKIWDKSFGGDLLDNFRTIVATKDGGFLLGGNSYSSISGEKTQSTRGGVSDYDYWVVRIDANGNKLWDKTFGGIANDYLQSIVMNNDGGFILGGYTFSGISGDKTQSSRGAYDYWIVKIDVNGNKLWDKTFGGNGFEYLQSIIPAKNGGFILGGYSGSGISGDKTEASNLGDDYWLVKIDSDGNKLWDKAFGGDNFEYLRSSVSIKDDEFIIGGSSESNISGDKTQDSRSAYGKGSFSWDYWILKIKENQSTTLTATGCTGIVTWSNGSTGNSITVSPSTATTYTATCTVNGCVSIASNSINVSASTNARIASIDENTENTDMDKDSKPVINFKVFPNPAKDKLTIQTDLEGEVTIQLYNDLGQKVLESSFVKQVVLPVGNLNRQAYYYLIQHDNKQFTGKVFLE